MNREEKLKKINDELEIMSDDELEQVAGGTHCESANDSRFLNVLLQGTKYHHCDRYGAFKLAFSSSARQDVRDAWTSLGIEFTYCISGENEYRLNGKLISQKEAWAHAEKLTGRHLTKAQWDW